MSSNFVSDGISQELSLQPAQLTPDKEGNLPPSALVPFCSYQGESKLLGRELPQYNITVCDKFQPAIFDGQLCYMLDIANIVMTSKYPSKSGKSYGLRLLLDPNPFQLDHAGENDNGQDFKVIIHTLAQYTKLGPGSYGMKTLKKMTGTKNFKQLPDHQKKCLVHDREECRAHKYLERVLEECLCIPWPLQIDQVK